MEFQNAKSTLKCQKKHHKKGETSYKMESGPFSETT